LTVLAVYLGSTALPVPQLLQGRLAPLQLHLLLATLFGPLVVRAFASAVLSLEQAARRSLLALDAAIIVGIIVLPALVMGVAAISSTTLVELAFLRNIAFFVGMTLLALSLAGRSTALALPICYFIAAASLGGSADGQHYWWAIVRGPIAGADAAVAVLLLTSGLATFQRRGRSLMVNALPSSS
jgi:hypothetical protein